MASPATTPALSPLDRALVGLLEQLRGNAPPPADLSAQERIFPTAASVLASLSNPRNLSTLTAQLLSSPAVWGPVSPPSRGIDVRRRPTATPLLEPPAAAARVMGVFAGAARAVAKRSREGGADQIGGGIGLDDWARAVAKGADERSQRWKHVAALTGVLLGLEGAEEDSATAAGGTSLFTFFGLWRPAEASLRETVEGAVVTASNLAMAEHFTGGAHPDGKSSNDRAAAAACMALVLSYAAPRLRESNLGRLDWTSLLPLTVSALTGPHGFHDGLWAGASLDADVAQARGSARQFDWSPGSASFLHLRRVDARPLVANVGAVSQLAATAVERARNPTVVVLGALGALAEFARRLLLHWSVNKLSELDASEEHVYLTPQTRRDTWPLLWRVLRRVQHSLVLVLRATVARVLLDPALRSDATSAAAARTTLEALRSVYFVSSRGGAPQFEAYRFTYYAAIDMLARNGSDVGIAFLQDLLHPTTERGATGIPQHPLTRTLDLFYLNTAEHFALVLPTELCDALIVQPALVYLSPSDETGAPITTSSSTTRELFEAAHAALLAAFGAPHNGPLAVSLVPFYIDVLLASFPARISPLQFRLAFATLVRIASPPYPVAASAPRLAETLLEMVRHRALTAADTAPLPVVSAAESGGPTTMEFPLSEQAVLVLALVDALPSVPLPAFADWLARVAETVYAVGASSASNNNNSSSSSSSPATAVALRDRFWELLVAGELDVERAAVAAAWWGTFGGRETLLYGGGAAEGGAPLMSGALPPPETPQPEPSRL